MPKVRSALVATLVAGCGIAWSAPPAEAAGPRNPSSSFNLSGINYGAQQWDRAQRQGKVVWPYYYREHDQVDCGCRWSIDTAATRSSRRP